MERTYALIKDGKVVNTIVADDDFINIIKDDYDYTFETTEMTTKPGLDWTYTPEENFRPPKPYPSWVWGDDDQWKAPVPYPTDGQSYYWNEDTLEWVLIETGEE